METMRVFFTCCTLTLRNTWELAVDGWNEMQDSYFVVEDMGVTFGVRLGGVDRVALYGHVLRCRFWGMQFIPWVCKWRRLELQRSGRWPWGVWRTLRCFHPCGATEQLQRSKLILQKGLWKIILRSTSSNTACAIQAFCRRPASDHMN